MLLTVYFTKSMTNIILYKNYNWVCKKKKKVIKIDFIVNVPTTILGRYL